MDTFLAIVSRREVRDYRPQEVPSEIVNRIVDAGRISGSSKNTQPWRFIVIRSRSTLNELAIIVTRPSNLEAAKLAIAIVLDDSATLFDGGRVAQNMMLAAWNDGVGSCPNDVKDAEGFHRILSTGGGLPSTILTFGYPPSRLSPERKHAGQWIASADRKPRQNIVSEIAD